MLSRTWHAKLGRISGSRSRAVAHAMPQNAVFRDNGQDNGQIGVSAAGAFQGQVLAANCQVSSISCKVLTHMQAC